MTVSNTVINSIVCYLYHIACQNLNHVSRASVCSTQTLPDCDEVSF
jgi:hypothetical protein